jgi:iron complex outermembrane receptor protein
MAQEGSSAGTLQEIVVTAEKRTENVQSIPNTISVFTASDLKDSGVSSTDELATLTPGLVINTVNGFGQPFIRGIGSDQVTSTAESAVGYYVDGVYFASVSAMLQELDDIERVEILKGPQGTLYGRNTTGGAINVVTRDPDPNGAAEFSVAAGNIDYRQIKAYASAGSPVLAASVAVVSTYHAGYMRNLFDGQQYNDENSWGTRAKIKYVPNEVVSLTFSADYSHRKDRGDSGYNPIDGRPLVALFGGLYGTNPQETYVNFPDARYMLTDKGESLTTRVHLAAFDVVSISAYRQTDRFSGVDLTASNISIENVAGPQPGWNWSQELQFISTGQGPLKWVAGAYAFGSRYGFSPLNVYISSPPPAPPPIPSYVQEFGTQDTNAYAIFGQAGYALTDAWTLTAGIRYNRDKKSLIEDYEVIPELALNVPGPSPSKTWTNTSPMGTLEYHQPGLLLYGKVSKGFKSGTFNVLAPAAPAVDPEKITAYEIGGKHDLLQDTFRVDWAGFYYDYKNLQVSTVQNGQPQLENAAAARTYGVDLDLLSALGPNLKAILGGEWLHSTYTNFPNAVVYIPDAATGGYGDVPVQRDVSGNTTIRAPKFTVSATLQYTVPVPVGTAEFIGTYYFNDGMDFDPGDLYRQGAYSLVNFRANLKLMGDHLVISGYGKNLLNREILSGVAPSNFAILAQWDAPRTWGFELDYRF